MIMFLEINSCNQDVLLYNPLKACTHTLILARSGQESAVESADSTTDSIIIGRHSILNMFNILNPLETIGVSRREISLVGTGLDTFNHWQISK